MTALAIVSAAHTTVPVAWTTPAGTTATVQMPTGLHAAYASDTHTATVVHLADAPQQAPALAPEVSPGSVLGLSGATLVGLGLLVWTAAKWKQSAKEVKWAFAKGAIATVLVGSWGLFGTFTSTVHQTGDSVGTSLSSTVGQGH